MTAREAAELIGSAATLFTEGGALAVSVTVEDVRSAFGRLDYQVKPVAGAGTVWVSAERVSLAQVADRG